ncbi:tetratricopeptide repeat protein [Sinomicrobium sp.]
MNREDLLYRYFSHTLSPSQKKALDELLQSDADFRRQFEFEVNLKHAIQKTENEKLKAKLQGFEAEIPNKTKKPSWFNSRNIAIAASVVLLIGVAGFYHFFGLDHSALYEDNFKTYPNTVYSITRSDSENTVERQAFVAYETEDYGLALEKFKQIPADLRADYIGFYEGQALLNLGRWDEALQHFTDIVENGQSFVAESHWYLSLIYLHQKDKTNAAKHLKTLMANYTYNRDKAKALLDKLN